MHEIIIEDGLPMCPQCREALDQDYNGLPIPECDSCGWGKED